MHYWTSISLVDYCLIGGLFCLFAAQAYFYLRYLAAPRRHLRRKQEPAPAEPQEPRGVSVIVAARNEVCNLEPYLQALLTQDYPLYEVIVVDDGSEDATSSVIDSYIVQYPRLRTTFVPRDAHVGSTKKLALTLAAKAARYDYLLLTDADCRPESTGWISEMMRGFDRPGTEIVLGYGAYYKENGRLNRLIRFDTLFNGLHYLGAALCHHPYMGVGRNLAYRKDTFFRSGGFSQLMTERAGDDDLLVNRIATSRNTAVVLTRPSITYSIAKQTWREWLLQKRRHLSVSPKYRTATKCRLALEPLTRGLFYLALILASVFGSPLTWGVAGILFAVRLLIQLLVIDLSAYRMGQTTFGLCVLWYDICLPLVSLYMLATQPLHKQRAW